MQNHVIEKCLALAFQITHPAVITSGADHTRFRIEFVVAPGLRGSVVFFANEGVFLSAKGIADPGTPQMFTCEIGGCWTEGAFSSPRRDLNYMLLRIGVESDCKCLNFMSGYARVGKKNS